jgi:hypothetical protein
MVMPDCNIGNRTCTLLAIVLGCFVASEGAVSTVAQRTRADELLARGDGVIPTPRLPRENLLVYRGPANSPMPVRSVEDWLKRREEILAGMQAVMGRLPGQEKRCPLDMKVEEEVDCGRYVRRSITYASEPGCRVPAYLLIPKSVLHGKGERAPAVLCLHGTDNVVGNGIVVGLGARPNRQYASELADRGYVALAPSYPLLARYQPDIKALGWKSGTLKAVWDNIRGLDLLESLPFVKPAAFGAIGHSLGGHNSVYTGVFDDRIKVVVSSCGLDSFLDYYGGDEKVWFPEKGWTQTRYMPRLAAYRGRLADIPFDFHELIAALAPRHVLVIAPLKDDNFRAESVDRVCAAARPVYTLYAHPERLRLEHPDCGHDFPADVRAAAYALFDSVLKFDETRERSASAARSTPDRQELGKQEPGAAVETRPGDSAQRPAARAPAHDTRARSPDQDLPGHIVRLTQFGERADFSHDGKRVLFVEKTFGDAYELDLESKTLRLLTGHYKHLGYTRALYLPSGDILLSGPEQFDPKDPGPSRVQCFLYVLGRSLTGPPTPLGTKCSEGPAVSRKRMHIAWTHVAAQYPEEMPAGTSRIYEADIDLRGQVPRLASERLVLDSRDLPFRCTLESQNFRPPDERELTFSAYGHNKTDVCGVDLATKRVTNYSNAPDQYDEPEGIAPNGRWTLVECDRESTTGQGPGHVDIWKLSLDNTRTWERLTNFNTYPGFKASNPVVSDDGRFMAFQLARSRDPAGVGYGIFLYDFAKASLRPDQRE